MDELNRLLERYNERINNASENLSLLETNFPKINLDEDILIQFNMDILNSCENLLNKLSLSSDELDNIKDAFSYYRLNQDLDLSKLIIRDSKCDKFINNTSGG